MPPDLRSRAEQVVQQCGPPPPLTAHLTSPFGCCPLCGFGEAGAEHLWSWCPAVAMFWATHRPDGSPACFGDALLDPGVHKTLVAAVIHQVSYWHSIALHCRPLGAGPACTAMSRALRYAIAPGDGTDEGDEDDPDPSFTASPFGDSLDLLVRTVQHCTGCFPRGAQAPRLASSSIITTLPGVPRIGGDLRKCLVSLQDLQAGRTSLTLHSTESVSGWIPPGRLWLPPPRVVPRDDATARWTQHWCVSCRHHVAHLVTVQAVPAGRELTVAQPLVPDPDAGLWPLEGTFDGGARSIALRDKVAGGGAIIWEHRDGGYPSPVGIAVLAFPGSRDSMVAESGACRTGLQLLNQLPDPRCRAARVVGDNLPVIRYGASSGRLRRHSHQSLLEDGLTPLALMGWRLLWQGVRRRFNQGADAVATLGVFWADALRQAGVTSPALFVSWLHSPPSGLPQFFPADLPLTLPLTEVRAVVSRLERAAATASRALRGALRRR